MATLKLSPEEVRILQDFGNKMSTLFTSTTTNNQEKPEMKQQTENKPENVSSLKLHILRLAQAGGDLNTRAFDLDCDISRRCTVQVCKSSTQYPGSAVVTLVIGHAGTTSDAQTAITQLLTKL